MTDLLQLFESNKELVYIAVASAIAGYVLVGLFNNLGNKGKVPAWLQTLPYFRGTKKLTFKDELMLSMLESTLEKGPCFVITDPALPDNPIVYASPAFCAHTGYKKEEVEGRNCRFLQGAATSKEDVKVIRDAIDNKKACSVRLLNYRKNGSTFINQFFLAPLLLESSGEVGYYLGVQAEVPSMAKEAKGDLQNPGARIMSYIS